MAELSEYRRKRDPDRTDEPMPPAGNTETGSTETDGRDADGRDTGGRDTGGNSFVIQEHHARALHWDFRLERDGVLVSWAIPKGLPDDPGTNHLAVRVEDHPLDYAAFQGTIEHGQYGAGTVTVWDRGSYLTETWTDQEVKIVLDGERSHGRFALFQTRGSNWMIHRMDAAVRPGWEPAPTGLMPMLAVAGQLPPARQDAAWAYEMKWDGMRAVVRLDGGRLTVRSRNDRDVTVSYPELRPMADWFGPRQAVIDGEIVCFDDSGRPSFGRLQDRMHVTSAAQARALARTRPVVLLAFDLLHHDGVSLLGLPYAERRARLEALGLDGPAWQTPAAFSGTGAQALRTSQEFGLEGVLAKRLASTYRPGRRSPDWIKIKNLRTQEVVIGGWTPGKGRRADTIGALLLGVPGPDGLSYVGKVGTGFNERTLADLLRRLQQLDRRTSPFDPDVPRADSRDAHWVGPRLVGEVVFGEWTDDGRLRHPSWRGLRPDKAPEEVRRES